MVLLNSCCKHYECTGADQIYEIKFHDFMHNELDSLTIVSYEHGSNFGTVIDSTKVDIFLTRGTYKANYYKRINPNLDYKIFLHNTGKKFKLTDFVVAEKVCNNCFPNAPTYYNALYSYSINGKKHIDNQIVIYKND